MATTIATSNSIIGNRRVSLWDGVNNYSSSGDLRVDILAVMV